MSAQCGTSASDQAWLTRLARRDPSGSSPIAAVLADATRSDLITFSGGFPAAETFPVDTIRGLLTDTLANGASAAQALQYSPTEGLPSARCAVADMIECRQGRRPENLLISSGGIDALQLLGRSLLSRGDEVWVGAPTYMGALMVFSDSGSLVRAIALDDEGLDVQEFEKMLRVGHRPIMLYVIPDHQNPAGVSLSPQRRMRLVELCRRHGVLIVEDVAYRDLKFSGGALPSLWSIAPDVVTQIGTFSKILAPGIRLGWAVGPAPVLSAMTAAKQTGDQCAGALAQTLMAEYLKQDLLEKNLAFARALYKSRADRMVAALERYMPSEAAWTRPDGGFFVWLTAPDGGDTMALAAEASQHGVSYVPGAVFCVGSDAGRSCMRLCYSSVTEYEIEEGIRTLSQVLSDA